MVNTYYLHCPIQCCDSRLMGTRLGRASVPIIFTDMFDIAIETATGWPGIGLVFIYSVLIAFILPGPSEVVLAAPLELGLPSWAQLAIIMFCSASGKALGSLLAFHIGQEAKKAGPIIRWLRQSRFDIIEWSENRMVKLAQTYGYAGLAGALCVPFFPDTISIYAFAVLEEDYTKFALATFLGSLGRLLVTILFIGGAFTFI
jgi:membrane protein YqaA with SNARE-associated domain